MVSDFHDWDIVARNRAGTYGYAARGRPTRQVALIVRALARRSPCRSLAKVRRALIDLTVETFGRIARP